MIDFKRIQRIHSFDGNLLGVIVPADIWASIEERLKSAAPAPEESQEDLAGFEELARSWSFRYPYDPGVKCQCGASTKDWRLDSPRLFRLACANLGGLLVFHCASCGASVRHKYFKDHAAVEFSPPAQPQA